MKGGGGGGGSRDSTQYLTPAAIDSFKALPNVKTVISQDYLQTGLDIVYGKLHAYGNIVGISTNDLQEMGLEADSGVTTLEKGSVIIGSWVPRNFYNPQARPDDPPLDPPALQDQQIKLLVTKYDSEGNPTNKTITVRVAGVLKETRGEADGSIYMRMEDVTAINEWSRGTRINRNKEGFSVVIVKADDPSSVIKIADSINELGYQAITPQSAVQSINSFFLVLQVIFGGVGAIALLVAAIGIANTMTMAILERTREIGLMKAIGAKNKDILSIFLGEAAGIGLVGGLGGVILGWGASALLNVVALSYFASQASSSGGTVPSMATSTPFWLRSSRWCFRW
jgi:putative ABC transport system permease protein